METLTEPEDDKGNKPNLARGNWLSNANISKIKIQLSAYTALSRTIF